MRALMWFRADLRVHDNTALFHACQAADNGVIAVFAICPEQWARHDWGGMKVDFLLRNLAELAAALAPLNIPIRLLRTRWFSDVPKKLLRTALEHGCKGLYFNEEYEINERCRDRDVIALFEQHGISTYRFRDQTILDVTNIKTAAGGWYTVFSPFKRRWLDTLKPSDSWPILRKPRPQKPTGIDRDRVPKTVKGFSCDRRGDLWPAGEREAARRLGRFIKHRIEQYESDRDFPALDGTSTLSPYIALGVISPRQCLGEALAANNGRAADGNKGILTWITELIWREFYRHVLIGFPRVCQNRPFRMNTDDIAWRHDDEGFQAWCEGRTGFPIVDAGMRQLAETGWMHNRVRMIVAMFLCKDLFIDWRWGERHFMRGLVDGDLANNNGGWQWSASTGTDAAPYFRIFNPTQQSRRFDPRGEYIRRFVPELRSLSDRSIHQPSASEAAAAGYPPPIVDRRVARKEVMAAFRRLKKTT